MTPHASSPHKVSFGRLIGDIVTDAKDLFAKEISLVKLEIRDELRQTKSAVISYAVGFGILTVGGLLVLQMLVHLLQELTAWPLWACYGVFGAVCLLGGIIFIRTGSNTADEIDFVPEQTMETLKKNADWLTGKKPTETGTTRQAH